MEHYESSADIDASTERVWSVLLDGADYPTWGSGVVRVEDAIVDTFAAGLEARSEGS